MPFNEQEVPAGNVRVAGVAWGGLKGVSGVQVRAVRRNGDPQPGEGEWMDGIVGEELSDSSWRQWVVDWPATVGSFDVHVRAIDRSGRVQTDERRPSKPDGATGHHIIRVNVEA